MKTWLITGCSSGLGKSLAWAVLKKGGRAVVTARNTETLESDEKLLTDLADLRVREQVMWASCVNTMSVFRSGVDNFYPWTLFSVGYIPRVAHGVSYRKALAAACPCCCQDMARVPRRNMSAALWLQRTLESFSRRKCTA